jgi:hypothetical protein
MDPAANINMVFNKIGGKITAGGYDVNSALLMERKPIVGEILSGGGGGSIKSKKNLHEPNKVSDRLNNLAVPAGIYAIHQKYTNINEVPVPDLEESAIIEEDLYDRLLKMAAPDYRHSFSLSKKNITRKKKNRAEKNTNTNTNNNTNTNKNTNKRTRRNK